jgi:folate-dependent phosphoribosylglycinamide formyltransferase PurN
MARRHSRKKISTTIASDNAAFLKSLLKRGQAGTLAEAIDKVISEARRAEARERLEAATEAYFASLSEEALQEENELGAALAHEAGQVNFDE